MSVTDLGSLLNDVVKKLLEEGEKGEAALKIISKAIIEVTEDSLKAGKLKKLKSERKK